MFILGTRICGVKAKVELSHGKSRGGGGGGGDRRRGGGGRGGDDRGRNRSRKFTSNLDLNL